MCSNNKLFFNRGYMKRLTTLSLTMAAGLMVSNSIQAADWPNWRGPDYTGISTETEWESNWGRTGPEILWKAKVGNGFSSVTTFNGKVFTLGLHGTTETIIALNTLSGAEEWKYEYPSRFKPKFYEGGVSSTPTVDPETGLVYVLGQTGELICLNAENGTEVWKKDLQESSGVDPSTWGLTGSPLVYGDLLVLNAGAHGMAVRKDNGQTLWTSGSEKNGYATPIPIDYQGKTMIGVFSEPGLNLVSPTNGERVYFYEWETRYGVNAADPVMVGDNQIYISSGYGKGGTLLSKTGSGLEKIWENRELRTQFNAAIYMNDVLIGIDGNTTDRATLNCLDPKSGKLLWSEPRIGTGGITAANGVMIVLTDRGRLMTGKASRTGFERISQAQVLGGKCWTTPVLSNGLIYCRNSDGDLVCVDVRQ